MMVADRSMYAIAAAAAAAASQPASQPATSPAFDAYLFQERGSLLPRPDHLVVVAKVDEGRRYFSSLMSRLQKGVALITLMFSSQDASARIFCASDMPQDFCEHSIVI